jgi:hypothetical protein
MCMSAVDATESEGQFGGLSRVVARSLEQKFIHQKNLSRHLRDRRKPQNCVQDRLHVLRFKQDSFGFAMSEPYLINRAAYCNVLLIF